MFTWRICENTYNIKINIILFNEKFLKIVCEYYEEIIFENLNLKTIKEDFMQNYKKNQSESIYSNISFLYVILYKFTKS